MFQFSLLFLLTRDTEWMAELINEKIDKRSFGVQILETWGLRRKTQLGKQFFFKSTN